jgi:carboxypeptidase A4
VIKYPHLASSEVIGHSVEGRPIRVIKISSNSTTTKPAVFMEAGIHAREWLGPPTVLHVIYQLTALAAENIEMLNLADWYILPVANPDGYDYSWTEVSNTSLDNRLNKTSEKKYISYQKMSVTGSILEKEP